MRLQFEEKGHYSDKARNRWKWSSHTKFLMQGTAAIFNMNSLVYFPGYLETNGYGAFLFSYLILKIFLVIPLAYMQLALGQYSEKGPLDVWLICPLSQGIGYSAAIYSLYVLILKNVYITYTVFYFCLSLSPTLPWTHCDHWWAKDNCLVRERNSTIMAKCSVAHNLSYCQNLQWETAARHFLSVRVLGSDPRSSSKIIEEGFGHFHWEMSLCLLLSCFIVFIATAKGLRNMEKVVNVVTIYPLVGLSSLLFATFLDSGANKGLKLYFVPNMEKLLNLKAWMNSFEVATSSIGIGLGMLITMGSYCQFRSPANMDATTLNIIDVTTTMLCGVICYNCVGIISYHFGLELSEPHRTNFDFAFVVVPEALAFLPGSANLWSLVYFSSLFCLAISTEYFILASSLSIIYDRFPITMDYTIYVSSGASCLLLLLGLPFCFSNGASLAITMNHFVNGCLHSSIVLVQVFIVLWVYGFGCFSDDVHFMLGFRPSNFYQGCWLMAPALCSSFAFAEFFYMEERIKTASRNVRLLCWLLVYCLPVALVPIMAVVYTVRYNNRKILRQVTKPHPEWGPPDPILMKSRRMFRAQAMTKEYLYRQSRLGAHARNILQDKASDT